MSKRPITKQGYEETQRQLRRLKSVDRPAIIQSIAEARAHGDLKENAEYHAAREKQSFLEARIATLESAIAEAQVVDVATLNIQDRVVFGAAVELVNLEDDSGVVYRIVGEVEANADEGRISVLSPVACALIGRKVGDVVGIHVPSGSVKYKIITVRYE
ncbi:MAG: transcription elongation factor GreA [Candidatus Eutrophobiaceae bacterium]